MNMTIDAAKMANNMCWGTTFELKQVLSSILLPEFQINIQFTSKSFRRI
jgi:hypothetical protein